MQERLSLFLQVEEAKHLPELHIRLGQQFPLALPSPIPQL